MKNDICKAILENTINTATKIAEIGGEPLRHSKLLEKRIFPDRSIPHPLKRRYKQIARWRLNQRVLQTRVVSATQYVQNNILISQPIPEYELGGTPRREIIYGETNEMLINRNGGVQFSKSHVAIRTIQMGLNDPIFNAAFQNTIIPPDEINLTDIINSENK